MDEVTIIVPSSSANCGPGYDAIALATEDPFLKVKYTRTESGIETEVKSPVSAPEGRELGYAGRKALEEYRKWNVMHGGAHVLFEDNGYLTGGSGRSGAEAVGAIMAAAVANGKRFSRNQVIALSAKAEPGEHKDNVAASTNGRFNIILTYPFTNRPTVDYYDVPENLGLAIGYSSHQKTKGTEGARDVLKKDIPPELMTYQTGLLAAITAALVTGNVDRVLELIWGDRFHELKRADAGVYGNFNAKEFIDFKRSMHSSWNIAVNVSGAGPNMQFLYNKDQYPTGIASIDGAKNAIAFFKECGIDMLIKDVKIAKEGAYDYAQRVYEYKGLDSF